MDNFSAARPEIERWHLLAKAHGVVHDFFHDWVAILVVLLAVRYEHGHPHDLTFGLLSLFAGGNERIIGEHALHLSRCVDHWEILSDFFGFIDVHDIEGHQVLQAIDRVEHLLLVRVLWLEQVILELTVNLGLVEHVGRPFRPIFHVFHRVELKAIHVIEFLVCFQHLCVVRTAYLFRIWTLAW